jgi:hypothetical protein
MGETSRALLAESIPSRIHAGPVDPISSRNALSGSETDLKLYRGLPVSSPTFSCRGEVGLLSLLEDCEASELAVVNKRTANMKCNWGQIIMEGL